MATISMTCLFSFTLIAFLLLAFQSSLLSFGDSEAEVRERKWKKLTNAVADCLHQVNNAKSECSSVGEKAAFQLHTIKYGNKIDIIEAFCHQYGSACEWHKFQCNKAAICKCQEPVRTWMIYAHLYLFLKKGMSRYPKDTVPEATFDARQFVCPQDSYEVYFITNFYLIFTLILPAILGFVTLLGILGLIIPNKTASGKASDTGPTSETVNQDMAWQEYPEEYPGQYQEYYQQYAEQYPGQYQENYQQYPEQYPEQSQQYPEDYPGQYQENYQQYPEQYAGQYQEYPGQYEQYPGQYQAYPEQYPEQYSEQYPEQYQQQAQQPGMQANPTDGVSQSAAAASNQQQPPLASTESSPVVPRVP